MEAHVNTTLISSSNPPKPKKRPAWFPARGILGARWQYHETEYKGLEENE